MITSLCSVAFGEHLVVLSSKQNVNMFVFMKMVISEKEQEACKHGLEIQR